MAASALPRSRLVAWFLVPLAIYCLFAALVYAWHGPAPELNIDHLSYMKLGDEIRSLYQRSDYFRSFNQVRAYGVLLAFAYDYTGSHIVSFKVALAVMTIAYLFAFQVFMTLLTRSPARAVAGSLLSALFVSFGASIWGVTDFSASLNRTAVIPFVVLVVWFFFRKFDSPWRYAIYPLLMLLSLLHLSAMHVILVFGVFEMLDFAIRRRFRPSWDIAWFAIAIAIMFSVQVGIEKSGIGATSYVTTLLRMAVPPANEMIAEKPAEEPEGRTTERHGDVAVAPTDRSTAKGRPSATPAPTTEEAPKRSRPLVPPQPPGVRDGVPPAKMAHDEAWRVELLAFPWRNMPLPLTTIAVIAFSFGFILLLAIAGAALAFRSGPEPLDRRFAVFALAVPIAAFGLQTLLWATRGWLNVLPINFEEVRSINMIMFPAIYFVYRLYDLAPPVGRLTPTGVRIAVVIAFVLQPVYLLRALPVATREAIIEHAVDLGVIRRSDTLRMLFAHQYLGLEQPRRFYYSAQPLVGWLSRNLKPDDLVLSNLNELPMAGIKSVGAFLGVLDYQIWEPRRGHWATVLEAVHRAAAQQDLDQMMEIAKTLKATHVVTDWPVQGAIYKDQFFYVVPVR